MGKSVALKRKNTGSGLELAFLHLWKATQPGKPVPVREFRFAAPERQWRFDFCWPLSLVAVEIDGGIFMHGRHTRGKAFSEDCEKMNAAVIRGWRVLRFTTLMLKEKPMQCVEMAARLVR